MKRSWLINFFKILIVCISCAFLQSNAFAAANTDGIQIYQKNLHLSEEHKQKLADDINRYHNADNIWDELRREFVLPHYEDNPEVQNQINWFMNHQDFLLNTANRAAPYLYFILQQTRKRHLPAEFVLLPMMESGYNPFAYSNKGASGIWQMMPGTASGFGIKQNWWYDGRRDVVASTSAALDYLTYLGSFFEGNWLLAIAAYDTGEGNVLSGIRKNIRDGLNTDYWSLPLADETRIYVPRLLALAVIISNPDEYPIRLPAVRNAPYLAQVDIGTQIDMKHASMLAGLSLKLFKQLNPGYNRSSTDPNGPYKIILPIEHVEQFTENLTHSPVYEKQVKWIRYTVRSGDTLASIAKKFKTSKMVLRKSNPRLASNIRPGKHLMIPTVTTTLSTIADSSTQFFASKNNDQTVSTPASSPFSTPTPTETKSVFSENTNTEPHFSNQASVQTEYHAITTALENTESPKYSLQPGDTLYMIRNGDDLAKVSRRFHVPIETLASVNRVNTSDSLHPGNQLIIPTHVANEPQKYQLASGDTIYMVRKGDDIEKIARRFHTTPSQIRLANLLSNNAVQEGDRLVIPTHLG